MRSTTYAERGGARNPAMALSALIMCFPSGDHENNFGLERVDVIPRIDDFSDDFAFLENISG